MLKVRVTFVDDKVKEMDELVETIEKNGYTILNQSEVYKGRGKSKYDNVYLDIEKNI